MNAQAVLEASYRARRRVTWIDVGRPHLELHDQVNVPVAIDVMEMRVAVSFGAIPLSGRT